MYLETLEDGNWKVNKSCIYTYRILTFKKKYEGLAKLFQ